MAITLKERKHLLLPTLTLKKTRKRNNPQPIKSPHGMFFCEGHLDYLPLKIQSEDTRYCKDCWAVIKASISSDDDNYRDYWFPNKGIFLTGGKGYGITPTLKTVCLGKEPDIQARISPRNPTTVVEAYKEAVTSPRMVREHLPTIPKAKKPKKQATPQSIKTVDALQSKSRRVKTKSRPKGQPVLQGSLF